jgi:hypothetical protein
MERNADGLARLLELFGEDDKPVHLYGPTPHYSLTRFLNTSLEYKGYTQMAVATYDHYWVSLVPALLVSGTKTQILQGWARGHVVVSTDVAARSVAGRPRIDLIVGDSTPDIYASLVSLRDNWPSGISGKARLRAEASHSPRALRAAVLNALGTVDRPC